MKRWTEGHVHLRMREVLKIDGFSLIAGEFPGGSDHELYPLNVIDPTVARDRSPDPRRHSAGELIPDIVALKGRTLLIGEAKVDYSEVDRRKLLDLVGPRLGDLNLALAKFSRERGFPELLPVASLELIPTLIFTDRRLAPSPTGGISYLVLSADGKASCQGVLAEAFAQ